MIEYQNLILNNKVFLNLCNENFNCNSFLFDSSDEVFLKNFSYCFAKFLFCESTYKKPCGECLFCQKAEKLALADFTIYPKNNKNILVDDVKGLIESVNLSPIESDIKVFIFNNFSSANTQAQNKLLKILEEPPKNTYIILNVTNINKVLPTVASRCKKVRLNKLTQEELASTITNLAEEDKTKVLSLADGNLTKALNYSTSTDFLRVYNDVVFTLSNLKNSSELLKFSVKFNKSRQDFIYALEIFEAIFRDILLVRLGKQNLVQNKQILPKLNSFAQGLTADATDKLIKKIYEINKQLEFNCNYVLLLDNFLLYYLEVKFLCNRK